MSIPETNFDPPFHIVRAGHLVLTAKDLFKSREFYTEVMGLVVSAEDKDTLYLRGLEERAHHSLVLKRSDGEMACHRLGMRVRTEEDLERAMFEFDKQGLPAEWAEVPFQGRTLHVSDPLGMPVEFVASMDHEKRLDLETRLHKGAASRRFDHYQVTIPDIAKGTEFWTSLGFRVADQIVAGDFPVGCFLHTKDTPYDLVFLLRDGPMMHHFGYIIQDLNAMIHACDVMGELGLGRCVEYGPGKHALGHSYFTYFLDPDGHRAEILLAPIVYTDGDDDPRVWDVLTEVQSTEMWGLPPQRSWMTRHSPFHGCEVTRLPPGGGEILSLEQYLQLAE